MSKLPDLTNEVTEIADNDYIYVWDASTPDNPDAKAMGAKLRPAGVKITNHLRYSGDITIPGLAAGVEGDATITVTGALEGDHVVFNIALPTNIAVLGSWVSAADTVTVRFRNTHASNAYSTDDIACLALVSRSTA